MKKVLEFKLGEVLHLGEEVEGVPPGIYVLLLLHDNHAVLCVVGEDEEATLHTTDQIYTVPREELKRFDTLFMRLDLVKERKRQEAKNAPKDGPPAPH